MANGCSAPNRRKFAGDPESISVRKIVECASAAGYSNIVLGAFGCGKFANTISTVVEAFKKGTESYGAFFENLVFAVGKTNQRIVCTAFHDNRERKDSVINVTLKAFTERSYGPKAMRSNCRLVRRLSQDVIQIQER
jgi:hypothetical protein